MFIIIELYESDEIDWKKVPLKKARVLHDRLGNRREFDREDGAKRAAYIHYPGNVDYRIVEIPS